jgi:hypothetical protein
LRPSTATNSKCTVSFNDSQLNFQMELLSQKITNLSDEMLKLKLKSTQSTPDKKSNYSMVENLNLNYTPKRASPGLNMIMQQNEERITDEKPVIIMKKDKISGKFKGSNLS